MQLERHRTARTARGAVREWLDSHRWTDTHRRLARHRLFAACSRAEIRWIRKWGDEVSVEAGLTLLREDAVATDFLVVLEGEATVSRRGRTTATIGPGSHAGDVAILSFGPQPATVTSATPCRLFVLGRRYLLSLAIDTPGFRHGMFPGLGREAATLRVREMRERGRAEFRRLERRRTVAAANRHAPSALVWSPSQRRGATVFVGAPATPAATPPVRRAVSPRARAWRRAVATVAVAALATTVAVAWHPGVLVVTPSGPIDVAREVLVEGVESPPVNGSYVLLPVTIGEPALGRFVVARIRGDTTARRATDQVAARRAAERDFAAGQAAAVQAVAGVFGRDPATMRVAFAPHDLGGSSASLVYALALADLLDGADLARGRTIAATGRVDAQGRVHRVQYVAEKAAVARAAGAAVLFVPPGQALAGAGVRVVEVATVEDAIAALRAPVPTTEEVRPG